uniref:Myriapod hemocyanin subunit typ 1a n=1 Tax=Hanseniella audax TaxID=1068629 RepID=I7I427_9MYRI|nr:myriapod hemocyanin subunit typ 1a [Hanseniella audax]
MRSLIVFCGLLAVAFATENCGEKTDVEAKQAKVKEVIMHINRPHVHAGGSCEPPPTKLSAESLKEIGHLDTNSVFSLFDERNWPEAKEALTLMMKAATFEDFITVAKDLSHHMNDDMFLFVFNVAIVHRDDTSGVRPEFHFKTFPDKYIRHDQIVEMRHAVECGKDNIKVLANPHVFNDTDDAHKLLYWLEDLGLNAHHYHWHTVHPAIWTEELGRGKERRGELFYWMHQQMIARYDAERLSNDMAPTSVFENFDEPIEEGYASDLTVEHTGYRYMFRPEGLTLHDLPELTKNQLRLWRIRILNAINKGYAYDKEGHKVPLNNKDGINIISNFVESSVDSINRPFYGNIHNYAHVIASRIADPDGKYGEDNGVMYDVSTSARDPLFYSWHKFINSLFIEHKDMLPEYTHDDLEFKDVVVNTVAVKGKEETQENILTTFYKYRSFALPTGFTFNHEKHVEIEHRHLDHEEFEYKLDITNNAATDKHAIIRLYLAPLHHNDGSELTLTEKRTAVIELDTFLTTLKPGHNQVTHDSTDSAVTYFHEKDQHHDCPCGWPQNLLLPKSNYHGMEWRLFAVVDDADEEHSEIGENCNCGSALSYCGIVSGKYPNSKAMGYPFDRHISAHSVEDWVTPNINYADITIKFTGKHA